MKKTIAVTLAAATLLVSAVASAAPKRNAAARFAAPVQVTPALGGGYEPNLVVDRFGTIYGSAHKENWELALSPDTQSPTYTRSMSWKWMSADDGRTWQEIPGLPLNAENKIFGLEGDMAIDGKDRLYFVDTSAADVSITRWTITGRGRVTFDFTRPLLPAAQAVDDRPWIAAHGDGYVYYLGNQGDKITYPLGTRAGTGESGESLGGRYTVYRSTDGGQTFDPLGITLSDSGWCRPDADPKSGYVYALCTNDGGSQDVSPLDRMSETGMIYAYVSPDRGVTWKRYTMGTYMGLDPDWHYPSLQVAPDGSIYALYVDSTGLKRQNNPILGPTYEPLGNKLVLFHSRNRGRTWSRQDITPRAGRYVYGWLSVAKDSKTLGLAVYHRMKNSDPWKIYGAMFRAGTVPTLVSLDDRNPVAPATSDSPPGDYLWCSFGPDGRLSTMWTRVEQRLADVTTFMRHIYYARSVTAAPLR